MADRTLQITIDAKDNASAVFAKVGDASKTLGTTLEGGAKGAAELQGELNAAKTVVNEAAEALESTGDSAEAMATELKASGDAAASLSGEVQKLEKDLKTVGMALTAVGAAGTAFFGVATHQSMSFTAAMANVQSIAQVSESELASLRDTILELSTASGSMPNDLADGLYDIVGSGFEAADAIEILTAATYAAGAGLTTTAISATAITAVLNAYQMSADQAGNVSDILFKIVDSGVISFETLSGAMGRTLPLAASLNISLEELGAAYAALTRMGYSGDMAETGIAALMTAAIGPTDALKEAVVAYGYANTEALIEAEGFAGFLTFLQREAAGSSERMLELTGNTRANGAALALSTSDGQLYVDMLEDMGSAAKDGAYTLEVFGIQMNNASGAVKLMQAEMGAATIALGTFFEPIVGWGAGAVASMVSSFNDMSAGAQGAAASLGIVASGTALFTGAAMLAVPQALQFVDAIRRIRAVGGLGAAMFGPWGIAIAGVTAALAIAGGAWMNHRAEVEATQAAYDSVGKTALEVQEIISGYLLSGGDLGLAARMNEINSFTAVTLESIQLINEQRIDLDAIFEGAALGMPTEAASNKVRNWLDSGIGQSFIQWAEENERLGPDMIQILMEGSGQELLKLTDEIRPLVDEYYESFDIPPGLHEEISGNTSDLIDAMINPLIDAEVVFKDWSEARDKYLSDPKNPDWEGYRAWLDAYVEGLPKMAAEGKAAADSVSGIGDAAQDAAASAEHLLAIFEKLPATIDSLRLAGDFGLADQLEQMHASVQSAFVSTVPGEFWGLGGPIDEVYTFIEVAKLTEPELAKLDEAWNRSMSAMSEGTIDNTRYMEDWNAILNDSLMTDAEKVSALELLSLTTYKYRDSNKAMQEGMQDFLSDGANILDWWTEYDRLLNQGAAALDGSAEQLARIEAADAFRGMVEWAGDMNDASRALDQALRTFQQIDDLGNRSSSAGSIAENLVGEPGVWHEIDDMLHAGKISLEEYNEAVTAGHDIQWSNMRVQDMLNDVRRKQLPLLAEEQAAYEENIAYLNTLNAEEQRRALMLQDSSVQTEIAAGFNLAYSASLGEIPTSVATEMIIEKANADQALKDIWLQMGLLREEMGPDGEMVLKVNFPDAETTISAISRLTKTMIELEALNRGMTGFELAVEVLGEEEAMALYGLVKNADGTYSKITIEADAEDNASPTLNNVKQLGEDIDTMKPVLEVSGDGSGAYTVIENLQAWNGRVVATALFAVQTTGYTGPAGIGWTQAHGGTIGEYATGGVLFRAGEIGAEVAHFPHGGTALIPRDGLYQAPAGTYISPNNAISNSYGGTTVNVNLYGDYYGDDDFQEKVAEAIAPVMEQAGSNIRRSAGVA